MEHLHLLKTKTPAREQTFVQTGDEHGHFFDYWCNVKMTEMPNKPEDQ